MTKQIKYSDDWVSTVTSGFTNESSKSYRRGKTIIYVSGNPSPEDIDPEWDCDRMRLLDEERDVKGSKVWKQYNKAEVQIMVRAIKAVVSELNLQIETHNVENNWKKLDLIDESWKIVFDRKAGCSCGCSPGFRFKTKDYKTVRLSSHQDVSIWIDLETSAQRAENEERKKRSSVLTLKRKIEQKGKELVEFGEKAKQASIDIIKLEAELGEAEKELSTS